MKNIDNLTLNLYTFEPKAHYDWLRVHTKGPASNSFYYLICSRSSLDIIENVCEYYCDRVSLRSQDCEKGCNLKLIWESIVEASYMESGAVWVVIRRIWKRVKRRDFLVCSVGYAVVRDTSMVKLTSIRQFGGLIPQLSAVFSTPRGGR